MQYLKKIRRAILVEGVLLCALGVLWTMGNMQNGRQEKEEQAIEVEAFAEKKFIKWVDFNVSYEALCEAYKWDVETYRQAQEDSQAVHVDWIELLAYVGAKHGGKFPSATVSEIGKTAKKLAEKETTITELTKDMEYYPYYLEAYQAVLGGYVGNMR